MPSFDVVSEVDLHQLTNAVDQAARVVANRFDFKGVDAGFERSERRVVIHAEADFQLQQMVDMLHEPYFDRKETDFRHKHPDALKELDLSYLSANLDGISFHDSIVVFDKKKHSLPKSELR